MFPSIVTTGLVPLNLCMLRDKHPDGNHVVECLPAGLVDCLTANNILRHGRQEGQDNLQKHAPVANFCPAGPTVYFYHLPLCHHIMNSSKHLSID